MATLSYEDLQLALRAALFTPGYDGRWGLNMLVEGDPGSGKTSCLREIARVCGLSSSVLVGATCDPTDFGSQPAPPVDGSEFVRQLLPGWVRPVAGWPDGGGVLVVDELTCVPAAQQAAMLGLVLSGSVGQAYRLHPRVRIMGACNPVEQAVGGQPLGMPTINRFGKLTYQGPGIRTLASIWRGDYARRPPIDALALEAQVLETWDAEYDRAITIVEAYHVRCPGKLQQTPRASSVKADQPWASDRTWEFVVRVLATAEVHGLSDVVRDAMVAAFIGDELAVEFLGWVRRQDLPDPRGVLDGTVPWAPEAHRPDRTQVVLRSCCGVVTKDTDPARKVRRARALWTLLTQLADTPDLGADTCTVLGDCPDLCALPEAVAARRLFGGAARAMQLGGLAAR